MSLKLTNLVGFAGGITPHPQNIVDASAPAHLESNIQTNGVAGDFSGSFWVEPVDNKTIMHGWANPAGIFELQINFVNGKDLRVLLRTGGTVRRQITTDNPVPSGYRNIQVSFPSAGTTTVRVDGLIFTHTGTDSTGFGQGFNIYTDIGLLADRTGGNILGSPEVSDCWIADDGEFLDFSVLANSQKFFNQGAVDLGVNGELPTGTAPLIFFGSDYVAADWNGGTNLGNGGTNFTNTGTFTDVV